jgi:TolB-like protein/Tfp pilus assembly protein PilF
VDEGRTSLAGRTLAHYRISTAIGAGGMGEVYRATDTKLAREIALKVLPPAMANDPDRLARFQREARAVAALNHPNVVTVYSVEESDNVHFITMELLEGEPLDRLISANGLPPDRIIEIAGAVAEALAAAHEKGIVHRDLKPANVMVTNEGRVKVLDFGLAKDVGGESANGATMASAGYTQAGMVMGTPAYMSPEQVSGRPLDHRSDIFSFGVMLHEMATGRRPFEGNSSAELISSILRDSPPSVTDVRPELSSDIARVIRRCLEKEPRHRVQTARDVSNEFRDLARTVTRPTPVSTAIVRATVAADSGAARAEEGFWVAVLPFKYTGSNQDLKALAEGLSEEVVTGLHRFSYLRVIARGSTVKFSGETGDIRAIGRELGARYVMEGSLRQAGAKLRLAVQLVDTVSGAHLWAENYERNFSPEAVFEIQDDLVPRIVSTVADGFGVLSYSMSDVVRSKPPDQLSPYEALLRSLGYGYRISPEEHAMARTCLERAVQQAPGYADGWAMLSSLYADEYGFGFNPQPDPLGRALQAARRAVDAAPSNSFAQHALAKTLFFRKEFQAFRSAAEQATALNPMDGAKLAGVGSLLAYAGDWEQGCAAMERAMQLNPRHPSWYWFPAVWNAYRKGDYRGALNIALKINLPGFFATYEALTAIYGQLGEREAGSQALSEMLRLIPNFGAIAYALKSKWFAPEMLEHVLDGMRKAGLEIVDAAPAPAPLSGAIPARTASGESRASEGFWVAVLPFKFTGSSADLKSLAEGLTDEIITGLSRFSYLRVIARGSTAKYSSESGDVRAIGKELGARYVTEGSLRQAGSKLRVTVQLADTVSGTHLWSETYECAFTPDAIFDLQDDLVPRIVATVADQYGVLPRSMSEVLRSKSEDALTPHEAVLRTFSYFGRIGAEEHAVVRRILERAVREAPDHADCWAMLSMAYRGEFAQGYNARPNSLDRALAAAQRAVDLAPTNGLCYYALATVHYFRKEIDAFRATAERSLTLNPMDGSAVAYLGMLIATTGEWDRGCAMVESAMKLNPNCPSVFQIAMWANAYRQGKYEDSLEAIVRANLPGYFHAHAARAATLGKLGRREEAQKALQELLALRPDFAAVARQEYAKWYEAEHIEQVIDGLRKAGMEFPEDQKQASAGT